MLPRHIWSILLVLLESNFLWTQGTVAADSFLSNTLVRQGQVQNVLEHEPVKEASCQHVPTGPIETTLCDYESIESVNDDLFGTLRELVHTPFFKYFQIDLYRECPFWQENGFCMNRECGITTVDETEVPERWRAAALSQIEQPPVDELHRLPGCYYRDSDFCFMDDLTEGDYFDLSIVPERYTGYSGPAAHDVWKSIYQENCFGQSELNLLSGKSAALIMLPATITEVLRVDGGDSNEQCLEKRVYYKIISGLHASISTHICHDYLNQTTGAWEPNLQCFVSRVASYPERLQYIYFNNVLLLRAVARLAPYLLAYDYCAFDVHEDHTDTLAKLNHVITIAQAVGRFDESVLFRGENANVLKEEFKQHFRNVSRIMDCVGCDQCRLWGKVQTIGVATALKVLFELDEKALDPRSNSNLLQRSEVVALINTLHRFSESLHIVDDFRQMWRQTGPSDSEELIHQAERAVKARTRSSVVAGPSTSSSPHQEHFGSISILSAAQSRLEYLIEICKQGTRGCMTAILGAWERATMALRTVYSPGKYRGPYVEL